MMKWFNNYLPVNGGKLGDDDLSVYARYINVPENLMEKIENYSKKE